jgi:hypothetical protein
VASDPQIAFSVAPGRGGIEVRVNFGLVAGREATVAEIDELARMLRPDLGDVTIVSETRHEIGLAAEAEVHLVRVELDPARMPSGGDARAELVETVVDVADLWVRLCVADRPAPL